MPSHTLHFRRIGDAVGVTFPQDVLDRYGLDGHSEVHLVETADGLLLTRSDPQPDVQPESQPNAHARAVAEAADEIEAQYANAFRELSR